MYRLQSKAFLFADFVKKTLMSLEGLIFGNCFGLN